MSTLGDVGLLVLGGALLYVGGEWLVKGSAGLARSLGVRPIVVGLTVVAFGTSAPEMVVSLVAAHRGSTAIAVGNVIGSNIANLGLILGLTALLSPPRVDPSLWRREVPLLLVTALVPLGLFLDGVVDRGEGVALLLALVGYTLLAIRTTPPEAEEHTRVMEQGAESVGAPRVRGRGRLLLVGAVGLGLLVAGGECFVRGASAIALAVGVSERVVGLTVVAVGTSLPELATSLVAAARGHADLAVGNVVGSNLFNVLAVLGGSALLAPIPGALPAMRTDLTALLVFTLTAVALLRGERRITRTEGGLLLGGYVAFLTVLAVSG